jgi:hypothetical protein
MSATSKVGGKKTLTNRFRNEILPKAGRGFVLLMVSLI